MVVGGRSVFTDMTVDENLEMQALTAGLGKSHMKERRRGRLRDVPVVSGAWPTESGHALGW